MIRVPDPEMGGSVQAIIQSSDGLAGDDELAGEFQPHLRKRIAGYRMLRFFDELPRAPGDQLLRHQLRRPYVKPTPPHHETAHHSCDRPHTRLSPRTRSRSFSLVPLPSP